MGLDWLQAGSNVGSGFVGGLIALVAQSRSTSRLLEAEETADRRMREREQARLSRDAALVVIEALTLATQTVPDLPVPRFSSRFDHLGDRAARGKDALDELRRVGLSTAPRLDDERLTELWESAWLVFRQLAALPEGGLTQDDYLILLNRARADAEEFLKWTLLRFHAYIDGKPAVIGTVTPPDPRESIENRPDSWQAPSTRLR